MKIKAICVKCGRMVIDDNIRGSLKSPYCKKCYEEIENRMNWLEYESKQNQKIPYIFMGIYLFMAGSMLGILYSGWYTLYGIIIMHIGIWGAYYKCYQIDKLYENKLNDKERK